MAQSTQSMGGTWATVAEDGSLHMPADLAAQYGLKPGSRVYMEPNGTGLKVRRSTDQLAKIYVEPSGRCNLDCVTCIRNVWAAPNEVMSEAVYEQILAGLPQFSPTPTIFFGGLGEPLMHPNLPTMIAQAKELGAPVEVITNGTLLTERLSKQLIEAGLDRLWVSLDGATPESYADVRLGASLPKVIANVKRFKRLRPAGHHPHPEIGISFVAMRRNLHDLPALMQLSRQLGANRLIMSNVLPYTEMMCSEVLYSRVTRNTTFLSSKGVPQLSIPKMMTGELLSQTLDQTLGRGWNVSFGGNNLGSHNDQCPFVENGTTSIGWDGRVSPCWPLLHDHVSYVNDETRMSYNYSLGNVAEQGLATVWNAPEYAAFRQRVQAFDFSPCSSCGGCDMAADNQTDCSGNEFPTCGGCLWAQGVVQCP